MKRIVTAILMLTANGIFAQYWGEPWRSYSQWIDIEDARPGQDGRMDYIVSGGVEYGELAALGLPNIAFHTPEGNGYYLFSGDYELLGIPPYQYYGYVMMFPPGILDAGDMVRPNQFQCTYGYCYDCACGEIAQNDTMFMAHGFGYWYDDPDYFNIWGIDHGYCVKEGHQFPYHRRVCPEPMPFNKSHIEFTDSLFSCVLPDTAVISGFSPFYMRAYSLDHNQNDTLYTKLYLEHHPANYVMVPLLGIDLHTFAGKGPSGKELGLNSFDLAKAELYPDGGHLITEIMGDVSVGAAIPEISIYTDNDTVYIRSDSMKIKQDLDVCLRIYDDADGDGITPARLVKSVGYQYISLWTANANLESKGLDSIFVRQYPEGIRCIEWQNSSDDCSATFSRDSLHVVGGELTLEAFGKLYDIPNVQQNFLIKTDTLSNDGIWLPTKWIRIDQDPSNSVFLDSLQKDRIRAIAWREGAGTIAYPPHLSGFAKVNHYWQDTFEPCENGRSTATGIMQVVRTQWDSLFAGLDPFQKIPGFDTCSWDSIAWNWTILIRNAKYIHDIYLPAKFVKPEQTLFPDSCSFAVCDTFPSQKNKEDLKTYGYTAGFPAMRRITTDSQWENSIGRKIPPISDAAKYTQDVRKYTYRRPWR